MLETGWPFGNRPYPETAWQMRKDFRAMACEINPHPLGYELRISLGGELYYSRVHATRDLAVSEADERKRDLQATGWTSVPSTLS